MEFRILGPLEVEEEARLLRLGGSRQRAVLALLLLHANEVVPRDRLIDALWGGEAPATARTALQVLVSQLRKLIGAETIETRAPGYLLHVDPERLDLIRFERLLERGRAQLAAGDPESAAGSLREALGLWRGPPLAELDPASFARSEGLRLEELRLAALEERIEADLMLGRHQALVAELEALVADHPLRDRLRGQLMLALYRSDRQAEALETYRRGRQFLADELGLEPSAHLRQLEKAILAQDSSLSRPPNAPPVTAEVRAEGQPAAQAGAVVRTFLIVDIRGYTRFTHAHGDEEAGKLAARFSSLAREAVTAAGGEVIELRGDEALCVFPSARQAIRAAVELQTRFRRPAGDEPVFPLGIGIGLDAGEAVPVEGGYRGGALNLAARLCSLAAPGQILASETVTSLARKVEGVHFVERRLRVKGLERPVRVIEVVPETELPPVPVVPRPRARRRRLYLIGAGALVLAAGVAAAVVALTRDSGEAVRNIGNAIAAIRRNGGTAVAYTEVGNTPSTIAVGEGAVWVLNADDRTISKIDPQTRRIVKTFGTDGITTDLAVGEGSVWVGNGAGAAGTFAPVRTTSVSRVHADSTEVAETVFLPGNRPGGLKGGADRILGLSHIAVGAGAVWAINPDASVSRISPREVKLVTRIHVSSSARTIAAGGEGVWVNGDTSELVRIDPRTNRVSQRIMVPADDVWGIAVGAGSLWATDLVGGLLWRIEPNPKPLTRTIDVGFGVTAVAYGAGAVWVTNFVRDEVVRVDPKTNAVTARIRLAGTPSSVATAGDTAWVTLAGTPTADVLPASACGPVLAGAGRPDVLIASDLPLQGPTAQVTRPAADAIRFVLREHRFRAGPHTVGYQSCDSSTAQSGFSDVLRCASNAKAYAATPRLVGVIGPFTSPCAWAQIPITNRAEGPLAMISPSNTHPGLTHAAPGVEKDEPGIYYPSGTRNYVRVTGPDDFEAAADALLAKKLGLRRVYVLGSEGIAETTTIPFRRAARRLGVDIVGTSTWSPRATSYRGLTERIARARPDGVFIGDLDAGAVIKGVRARLGRKVVLIGGEYHLPPSGLLMAAGPAAVGMYVSTTAVAHEGLSPAGQRFLRGFAKTQPGGVVPSALYIPEAAQAAEALLAAIARSDGTRASVNRELRELEVKNSILGSFRFDRNGDIDPAAFTIFRITGKTSPDPNLSAFDGAVVDRVVHVPSELVGS